MRFNPTLVRLRQFQRRGAVHYHLRFNPTLVRLRREMKEMRIGIDYTFQSHAGSIEAYRMGGN